MAKGFKYGAGGGTSLNFKVVGNPQPSNPVENTVWIDTDTPITSYIFSAAQPTGEEGMVWIATGTTGTIEFNALKKNNITVQILSASQYVSGAWLDKEMKIYQGGAWVELWNGELFVSGNQYESVTGGWSRSGYSISDDFNSTNNSQVTIGEQIVCKAIIVNDSTGTDKGGACGTVNKVDITGYTKLRVKGSVSGYRSEVKLYVGVSTTKALTNSPTAKIALTANGDFEKTLTLPTSASSYYIFVLAAVYSSVVLDNTTTLTVDSTKLE